MQVRARVAVVAEIVADRVPGRAAVVGALDHLAEPAAGLRGIEPVGVRRRAGDVEDFPAAELHEHNERRRIPELVAALARGETIAVVSDAGTPLLSDPGYPLTRAAIAAGARVEAIPGPSAILAALVASGLPPYPFTFAGFPPPKAGKRRTFYRRFGALGHTLVVYESPHRLAASLDDAIAELGPERPAALARELTKLHEEIVRGTLADLAAWARERKVIGELVLVIGSADDEMLSE
jgi:16S rRNA (cytidine1402-2'-O)-methyltransferase